MLAQSEFAMFEVSAALCGSLSGTVNESRISKDGQGPSGGMGGKIMCQSRLLIATYPGELFIYSQIWQNEVAHLHKL